MAEPVDLFRAELEALVAAHEAAIDASVARVLQDMATVRRDLLARIAEVPEGSFNARVLPELLDILDDGVKRYREQFSQEMEQGQAAAATRADLAIEAVARAVGVEVRILGVTLPTFDALGHMALDLITQMTDNMRTDLRSFIYQGTLGTRTPYEVMQDIRQYLTTNQAEGLHGAAWRAEAITRTEIGRVYSEVTQQRLEQALSDLPGLLKEWRHSGGRNPRSGHQAANGQRVPVREPFLVAPIIGQPTERLQYPRDAAASARNTVNCRCTSTPWMARWGD
jgi:hypothetical protein